ncbi:hypothetical protein I7I53_06357 [Histoplasma capsulatum var. duboisii H88]|uniref:Uncharacterized protein n=1 Tax=Ajellomyces capsulatus (strain H88) TaxID=544711 RepID=A0A8A1LH69_AJEC8|nr:hypothetical protein I7I53_06357 [Histoplasma capsulatum var. duboisii H88]
MTFQCMSSLTGWATGSWRSIHIFWKPAHSVFSSPTSYTPIWRRPPHQNEKGKIEKKKEGKQKQQIVHCSVSRAASMLHA